MIKVTITELVFLQTADKHAKSSSTPQLHSDDILATSCQIIGGIRRHCLAVSAMSDRGDRIVFASRQPAEEIYIDIINYILYRIVRHNSGR